MTLAEQIAQIRRTVRRRPASSRAGGRRTLRRLPASSRRAEGWRVVTIGPGEEDWAVVDRDGHRAFVGPVVFAARFAADLEDD